MTQLNQGGGLNQGETLANRFLALEDSQQKNFLHQLYLAITEIKNVRFPSAPLGGTDTDYDNIIEVLRAQVLAGTYDSKVGELQIDFDAWINFDRINLSNNTFFPS